MNSKKITSFLKKVKTIAIVGASTNPQRDSYKVMEFLICYGYKVFPVNPNESNNMIASNTNTDNHFNSDLKQEII